MKLPKRALGKTGLTVSRLCFGSLTLGPLQRNLPPEKAGEILVRAFQMGVNFVDTAQYYQNYPHLRAGLARFQGDVIISSKTYAYTSEQARVAVEEARAALGRDVIDIFLLHEQEGEDTLRGHRAALEELYRLKANGTIRAVGLSTHHIAGVDSAARWGLDVVHPLYNLTGLGIADGTAEQMGQAISRAHEAGLGVFAMKALGGGHHYARAQEALQYVMGHDGIDSVAVGMQSVEEVRANVEFFSSGEFSGDSHAAVAACKRVLLVEEYCTGCGACVERCPAHALAVQGSQVRCDASRCLLCGYCAPVCSCFCLKIV